MNQKKVGKFIANLRKERSLTQMQLSEKLGVLDKTVSKWERGVCSPDISLLNDLSKMLNVTTTELLNGEREKTSIYTKEPERINKALLLFLNNCYDNCHINIIESLDCNYYINGLFIRSREKEFININSVKNISNFSINQETVYSYEYSLNIQDNEIYKIGNILLCNNCNSKICVSVNDVFSSINLYVSKNQNNLISNFSKEDMCLIIKYVNQDSKRKKIKIPLLLNEILFNNDISFNNKE